MFQDSENPASSQVVEGSRRLTNIQPTHQRGKTNGGSEYWSSATQPEMGAAPGSKLTPHPKIFGVESQNLLQGKMYSNVDSAQSKESRTRGEQNRSKEN